MDYAPVGAIAFRDSIAEAFYGKEEDRVEFSHGHTFGGNPLASVAAIANIREMIKRKSAERAKTMDKYLWQRLKEIDRLRIVGDIRGKGLIIGMEFVKNEKTKESFGDNVKFAVQVGKTALKKGLIIRYPN